MGRALERLARLRIDARSPLIRAIRGRTFRASAGGAIAYETFDNSLLTTPDGRQIIPVSDYTGGKPDDGRPLITMTEARTDDSVEKIAVSFYPAGTLTTDDGRVVHAVTQLGVGAALGIPILISLPLITGTLVEGNTLTASPGSWNNSPTSFAYLWNSDGAPITGAGGSTYDLVAADAGHAITVSVVASNDTGPSLPAVSAATAAITAASPQPVNITVPVITGTATEGQTLTGSNGTWQNTPSSFTRQWKRDGADIAAATAATYTLVTADVGHVITLAVVATNTAGPSTPAVSTGTASVAGAVPTNQTLPAISGNPQQGSTLATTNGVWTASPTSFAYQWKRDGSNIGSATASTYVLQAADVGHAITMSVVATNGTGASTPAVSSATGNIVASPTPNMSAPTIAQTSASGQKLEWTTTLNSDHAEGYWLVSEYSTDGVKGADGTYTSPGQTPTEHILTPQDFALATITDADWVIDGFVDPGGAGYFHQYVKRDDGTISDMSNEIAYNVTVSVAQLSPAVTDKNAFLTLSGAPLLVGMMNANPGVGRFARTLSAARNDDWHMEVTIANLSSRALGQVFIGINDGTPDFSAGVSPGLSSVAGFSVFVTKNSTALKANRNGAAVTIATLAANAAVNDRIVLDGKKSTNQITVRYYYAATGTLSGVLATLTLTGAYIPSAWFAHFGGTNNDTAGGVSGDSFRANFGDASTPFIATPTAGASVIYD